MEDDDVIEVGSYSGQDDIVGVPNSMWVSLDGLNGSHCHVVNYSQDKLSKEAWLMNKSGSPYLTVAFNRYTANQERKTRNNPYGDRQ